MKHHATVYSGFRRIADEDVKEQAEACPSPEHYPPTEIGLGPGTYEYTCPECGHVTIVKIPKIAC